MMNRGHHSLRAPAADKVHEHNAVSLSDWLAHTPPDLVAQHLNVDPSVVGRFTQAARGIVPA
jgi:oxalate decarboxylase